MLIYRCHLITLGTNLKNTTSDAVVISTAAKTETAAGGI